MGMDYLTWKVMSHRHELDTTTLISGWQQALVEGIFEAANGLPFLRL